MGGITFDGGEPAWSVNEPNNLQQITADDAGEQRSEAR